MTGAVAHGRSSTHFYYVCTRQNHEGGKFSCSSPRIPAEALENAVLEQIRVLGNAVEARERIVAHALSCLDSESDKLMAEADILRRQQQKTRAEIGRLVDVLKSLGTAGIESVRSELTRLENEEKELTRKLRDNGKRQEPMQRISDEAASFIRTWQDVGELLEAATPEERLELLRHYVEVIELHSDDPKGKTGTYAMRLFPEVRPDRGFDFVDCEPESPPDDGNPVVTNENGVGTQEDDDSAVLTDSRLVRVIDVKALRKELSS